MKKSTPTKAQIKINKALEALEEEKKNAASGSPSTEIIDCGATVEAVLPVENRLFECVRACQALGRNFKLGSLFTGPEAPSKHFLPIPEDGISPLTTLRNELDKAHILWGREYDLETLTRLVKNLRETKTKKVQLQANACAGCGHQSKWLRTLPTDNASGVIQEGQLKRYCPACYDQKVRS